MGEDQHAHHPDHVNVACPTLETDGHVPSGCLYDTLGQDGAKLCHHILVLVAHNLLVESTEILYRLYM